MKIKILGFIVILILASGITTLFYQNTQQANINYHRGHRLFEKGKYDKAIKFYKRSLTINPSGLDALKEIAYSYQRTGRYEKAIEAFEEVLSRNPQDNKIKKSLAETLSWQKEYKKAVALYEEIVKAEDDVETRRQLAEVYIWDGQLEKARNILEIIRRDNPEDTKASLLLAKAMHYSGKAAEAGKIYEELLGEERKHKVEDRKEIKQLLAEAYTINKDYEGALKEYRKILEEEPENVKVKVILADILSWEKRYDESISEYEKVLEIEPDNLEVQKKLARVYTWVKDYRKAEVLYKDIIRKNPQDIDAHAALGQVLVWGKRYAEAIYYFETALSEKEVDRIKLLYGQALLFSGDYKRAGEIFQEIVKTDSEDTEASVYLADAFASGKEYGKAISLYEEVLQGGDDLEVKKKLADVLTWDRQYRWALGLYDEILSEKEDTEVRLQKARVSGWARKYDESLKEYQRILDGQYNSLIELEMKAKRAYWNNRVKNAICYYKQLIEKGPDNVEAMFDLSQIYSYQSMWEEAIGEYRRILALSPGHFRAKEGLQKVELMATHFSLESGYSVFEAASKDRVNDIDKHTFSNQLHYPVNYNLSLDVEYNFSSRSFSDFSDVSENEGRINLAYIRNPQWHVNGFYSFAVYDEDIDSIHTFGGDLGFRIFDVGTSTFSYQRERLENSSEVIRGSYYRDNLKGRLDVDINKRCKLGMDYLFSDYSDDNSKHEPGFDVLYYLSLEPKKFSVKYRYFYRDFDEKVQEYFSPEDFWTHELTFDWRHFLNKEEIFFGADDIYYDLIYGISVDSEDIVGHKFGAGLNWDINKRLNFNIQGSLSDSSDNVYEDKNLGISIKYWF